MVKELKPNSNTTWSIPKRPTPVLGRLMDGEVRISLLHISKKNYPKYYETPLRS